MQMYSIPPDMGEKEKVVGGILNLVQLFWILGGLGVGAVFFSILFPIIGGQAAIVVSFFISLIGTPFAFYKKRELTLYQYLTLKRKFKKKAHKLPNIQEGVKF